jgi:hypothetical protein
MPNTAGVTNLADPQRRVIAVPASGSNPVLISASIFTGYAEIQECGPPAGGAFAPQGMLLTRADENYANNYEVQPGAVWPIGDTFQKNRSIGVPQMGMADGSTRPATPWVKLVSLTATATQVEVREWRQR